MKWILVKFNAEHLNKGVFVGYELCLNFGIPLILLQFS